MTWTKRTKPTTTYTTRTKPTTSYSKRIGYLLQETGDFLLWEDGTQIVLGGQYNEYTDWSKRIKP